MQTNEFTPAVYNLLLYDIHCDNNPFNSFLACKRFIHKNCETEESRKRLWDWFDSLTPNQLTKLGLCKKIDSILFREKYIFNIINSDRVMLVKTMTDSGRFTYTLGIW